MYLMKSASVLL